MNNFLEILEKRNSTRRFLDKPLESDQVETILRAGLLAPSSKNRKPVHLIAIEDKSKLEKLSQCKSSGAKFISDCALAVIVAADPFTSDVWIEYASIAAILMQLQATDLDIGSCWIQIRERHTDNDLPSEEFVKNIIEAPLQIQILAIMIFGYKNDIKDQERSRELGWENVHIDKF